MRIRLKFKKEGRLKYIGHLDLLNVFSRALKASKLPVEYSRGFSPHMKITFAAPLPLGVESVSEYVDIDFDSGLDLCALPAINEKLPDGLEVTDFFVLEEPYRRAPAIVVRAEYYISLHVSDAQIKEFLAQEAIMAVKKTKRKEELTDIKPDIHAMIPAFGYTHGMSAILSCGSTRNLKPDLLVSKFKEFHSLDIPEYRINIVRTGLFDENGKL
jgi:radical SAM-linked protein